MSRLKLAKDRLPDDDSDNDIGCDDEVNHDDEDIDGDVDLIVETDRQRLDAGGD